MRQKDDMRACRAGRADVETLERATLKRWRNQIPHDYVASALNTVKITVAHNTSITHRHHGAPSPMVHLKRHLTPEIISSLHEVRRYKDVIHLAASGRWRHYKNWDFCHGREK